MILTKPVKLSISPDDNWVLLVPSLTEDQFCTIYLLTRGLFTYAPFGDGTSIANQTALDNVLSTEGEVDGFPFKVNEEPISINVPPDRALIGRAINNVAEVLIAY